MYLIFRNFYHYLVLNSKNLNLDQNILDRFKINMRNTSRYKFLQLYVNNPKFMGIYHDYLNSRHFDRLVNTIKLKYDDLYIKLFLRHSINFLNFHNKEKYKFEIFKDYNSKSITDE